MELISKQTIIDHLDNVIEHGATDSQGLHPLSAEAVRDMIIQLPPEEPQLVECDPMLAADELAQGKITSAYHYRSILKEFGMMGYVLAKKG